MIGIPTGQQLKLNGIFLSNSRYYNKDHIELRSNGITSDEDNNSLSDYELFKTQHKEVVFVEQIISHCSVNQLFYLDINF